jgi:hypothetical protein
MAHTKAIGRPGMGRMLSRHHRTRQTGAMVKYFAGGWSDDERAAIEQELDRQGVRYTLDGDDLLVHDDHQERMVDMLVESITET